MDYKIIKKFLPKKYFISLKETLHSIHFPWYHRPRMTKDSSGLFFTHSFFTGNKFNSDYFDLSVLYNELKVSRLDEVRANLTLKYDRPKESGWHTDNEFSDCLTAIFFLDTCNSTTLLGNDKIKIKSKENSILIFKSSTLHKLITQTDVEKRIVLNINFFPKNDYF